MSDTVVKGVFGCVGLIRPHRAELFRELTPTTVADVGCSPWDGFGDGAAVLVDAEDGRLLLAPGAVYLVNLSGGVRFRDAAVVVVCAVLAGDVRFKGPGVTVEHSAALKVRQELAGSGVDHVRPRRGWERTWDEWITRPFAASGLVRLPPGADPVRLEVYAAAEPAPGRGSPGEVEWTRLELSAVGVGTVGTPEGAR